MVRAEFSPERAFAMTVTITPIYVAILAVLYVALSLYVVRRRYGANVSLGDGGDADLISRIRMHGNFSEYAPFGLLVLLSAELAGAAALGLHLVGLSLCLGRLFHALALAKVLGPSFRKYGMVLTFLSILTGAGLGLFG
jgi:uncharacterized protein